VSETRPDGARRLTTPPSGTSDQNAAFSPDGTHLVFSRFDNGYNLGPAGLFLLEISTDQTTRLTPWEDQDNVNLPGSCWNPVLNQIVFASDRMKSDDLWQIAPDGSDIQAVITAPSSDTGSPDGRWIVFSSDYGGLSVPNIFVIPVSGGQPAQVTFSDVDADSAPSWSPDGEWIAFESRLDGAEDTPSAL
jgi:TolB protein